MDDADLSPQSLAQMSEASLQNFKNLNDFAQLFGITISGIYVYIAIGALNLQKLDDDRVMFAPVSPTQAAKALGFGQKRMGRWLITLSDRGLLLREGSGDYKVADLNTWRVISKLVGVHAPAAALSESEQGLIASSLGSNVALTVQPMRDRL